MILEVLSVCCSVVVLRVRGTLVLSYIRAQAPLLMERSKRKKSDCMLLLAAAIFLVPSPALAFNLDVAHATIFADPSAQKGSYFGFSVGLMRKKTGSLSTGGGWLVVGAPRGNTPLYPDNIIEPGVAYLCGLEEGRGQCKHMILDDTGNDRFTSPNGYFNYADNKNHSWIGASVAVQDNGGKIVVCGPKWKNKYYTNFYLMNGVCYWLSDAQYFDRNAGKLIPLLDTRNQGFPVPPDYDPERGINLVYYYAYGGAGLSVDFVSNSSDIIIGAPGVFDWKGTVIRYRKSNSPFGSEAASLSHNDLAGTSYDGAFVPNPYRNEQFKSSSYFGYSVASGRFYNSKKVQYVAGAPRAGDLKGKVFIFEFPQSEDSLPFLIKMELEGSQFGEYFGSSICVLDLNSDGLDDLVVGAPLHSIKSVGHLHQSGDEGRIYVFLNEGKGIMTEIGDNVKVMGSQAFGSRFGTAISNTGDLNGDGYPDIAVGAPYENFGAGAIYIYHGTADGINPKFVQRITAQEIDNSLLGFGISITKGADIDANHYNDIAVGAFSSGHAVLLRSHPVITFHNKLTANVSKININATGFMITSCVFYTGTYAPSFTDVTVILRADPSQGRARLMGSSGRSQTLEIQHKLKHYVEQCENIRVEIVQGTIHDLSKPIQIIMETEIREPEKGTVNNPSNHRNLKKRDLVGDGFCGNCPVVDPHHSSHVDLKVPYATGCGEDNICRTDLKSEGFFVNVGYPYVIGSSQSIRLNVTVKNMGDPAFFSQTKITFPKVAPLIRIPQTCQEVTVDTSLSNESNTERILLCETGNPLRSGVMKEFHFEFDAKQIPIGLENLVFTINASSVGEELTPGDNVIMFNIPLKTLADVTISGKSSQNQFYFHKEEGIELEKMISFSHVYEVQNYGPSSIDQVKMIFEIPTVLQMGEEHHSFVRLYHPQTSLNSHSFSCSAEGGEFYSDPKEDMGGTIIPTGIPLSTSFPEASLNLSDGQPLRHKRSTSQNYIYSLAYFPNNKTLFVNCSNGENGCIRVTCISGPLKASRTGGVIIFPIKVISSHLDQIFENKDVILFSTSGRVEILGMKNSIQPLVHKPDLANVHTLFFGKIGETQVDSWIIAVAIAGGILLLFLIVMALMKMGFFKRSTKDELEALKSKIELEEQFGSELE